MRKWPALVVMLGLCGSLRAEPPQPGLDLDNHLGTRWYGVYVGGKKSGYAVEKSEKTKRDGRDAYTFSMGLDITISLMGRTQKLQTSEYRTYYASGPMAECGSSVGAQSWRGLVQGDTMKLITIMGEMKSERTIPAPGVSLSDEIAPLRLIMGKPKPGDSVESRMFTPMIGKELGAVVTVIDRRTAVFGGVETDVYEINTNIKEMGVNSPALMTQDGEMLQMTLPAGGMKVVLKLQDEKSAKDPSVEAVEMLDASTIRPAGKPPKSMREKLRLRITGLNNPQWIINDERQSYRKLDDASYEVTLRRDAFPKASPDIPIRDLELQEYTRATDLYQSDHPDVVKKATEIIGDTKNSARVAQALCLWVYANVAKRGTVTLSNALETLQSMEGDCGEHAALFVGLCRAVGLPARVANGIAYSGELGAFGGHAWAEVYVGEWVAVDPTFGQPLASASRIKFADDDLLQTARLLQIIADLKIEFLQPDK